VIASALYCGLSVWNFIQIHSDLNTSVVQYLAGLLFSGHSVVRCGIISSCWSTLCTIATLQTLHCKTDRCQKWVVKEWALCLCMVSAMVMHWIWAAVHRWKESPCWTFPACMVAPTCGVSQPDSRRERRSAAAGQRIMIENVLPVACPRPIFPLPFRVSHSYLYFTIARGHCS